MGCACSDTVGSKRTTSKRRRNRTRVAEESDSEVEITVDADSSAARRAEAERMGYYYESDEEEQYEIPDLDDSDEETDASTSKGSDGKSGVYTKDEILEGVKQSIEEDSVEMLEEWVHRSPTDIEFVVYAEGHEMNGRSVGEISALMYTILLKRYACENFLLSSVSDEQLAVDFTDSESGDTALHWAVRAKSTSLIGLLLAKGANKLIRNRQGDQPLDICLKIGDPYDIHQLLEPYTKLDVRDSMYIARSSALLGSTEFQAMLQAESSTQKKKKKDDDMYDIKEEEETRHLRTGSTVEVHDLGRGDHKKEAMESLISASRESLTATESLMDNLVDVIAPKGSVDDEDMCGLRSMSMLEREDRLAILYHERSQLPIISGWLEKKAAGGFYKRRWVVCRDGYMLWSETKVSIQNVNDPKERKRFPHEMYLLHLKSVTPVITTASNKLQLVRIDPKKKKERTYVWKCADTKDRDAWIEALRLGQEFLKNMIQYLKSGTEYDVTKSEIDEELKKMK